MDVAKTRACGRSASTCDTWGLVFAARLRQLTRRERDGVAIARRLRYRKDMREVPVPKLGRCDFHCFLSHVWGTGQNQMRIVRQRLLEMLPGVRAFLDVRARRLDARSLS